MVSTGVALLLGWAFGCGSGADVQTAPVVAPLPPERLQAMWPVIFAREADLGPVSSEGWTQLVNRHDLAASVRAFGPDGGAGLVRAHAEAAALFRQAALLQANSVLQTYAVTPEPTDPVGVAHLVSVAYAVTGDLAKAREWSGKLDAVPTDPTVPWHTPWKAWLASAETPVWPPDLQALPEAMPPPTPGVWPELGALPHYQLPEQAGSTFSREMGDPGALVRLALWHEAAARTVAAADGAALSSWLAPYRLPVEAKDAPAPTPAAWLFGGEYLVPEDAAFLADLRANGAAAVEAWRARSALAELAARSRGASGRIDPLAAADHLAALRDGLAAEQTAKNGGAAAVFHRVFVEIAAVGATRHLALVAEAEGDREVAGRLRIAAMERSQKESANPAGLMALAAWDAGNRYPMRAQDILHSHLSRFPALEVARYGLDVLALRVSRERPGESAGM